MTYGFIGGYGFDVAPLFQFTIMMLTITTVFYIVQIIAGFFTQKTQTLSTSNMELLLTIRLIALHTGAHSGAMWFTQFLANIAIYKIDGKYII